MNRPRVLIVDDEPDLCELLAITLTRMGLASHAVGDVAAAKAALRHDRYDLCLTDMQLPDGNGLDLVEWLSQQHPAPPCAVITAHVNVESAVRALKLGAFDFVSKPLDLADLRKLVAQALKPAGQGRREASANETPSATLPRLLGTSPAMEQLRDLIARVARRMAVALAAAPRPTSHTTNGPAHAARRAPRPSWVTYSASASAAGPMAGCMVSP